MGPDAVQFALTAHQLEKTNDVRSLEILAAAMHNPDALRKRLIIRSRSYPTGGTRW